MTKYIQKTCLRLDLPTYWSSASHCNRYTKEPTVSGGHRKAFDSFESCLTGSSWIQLIHLIKRNPIQNRKNTNLLVLEGQIAVENVAPDQSNYSQRSFQRLSRFRIRLLHLAVCFQTRSTGIIESDEWWCPEMRRLPTFHFLLSTYPLIFVATISSVFKVKRMAFSKRLDCYFHNYSQPIIYKLSIIDSKKT